jgi:hypothetical protein
MRCAASGKERKSKGFLSLRRTYFQQHYALLHNGRVTPRFEGAGVHRVRGARESPR